METIGQLFRTTRERKELSLSQVAAATRIKIQHIESMESDDFSRMAAATYARGFIKIYAEYLGLNPEPLIRQYTESHAPQEVASVLVDDPGLSQTAADKDRAVEDSSGGATWTNLALTPGVIRRILLPVGLIVVAVLIVSALMKALQSGNQVGEVDALPGDEVVSPLLGDPPDAYLEVDPIPGRQP